MRYDVRQAAQVLLLAVEECLLRPLAVGRVEDDALHAPWVALCVVISAALGADPMARGVGPNSTELDIEFRPMAQCTLNGLPNADPVLIMECAEKLLVAQRRADRETEHGKTTIR